MANLSSDSVTISTTIDYLQLLRNYLSMLVRRWKWILAVGLITALLIFGYRSLGKQTYTSRVDIAYLTTRTSLAFDEKIVVQDATVPFYLDESRWDGLTSWATNQQLKSTVHDLVYEKFYANSETPTRKQFDMVMNANREGDVLHLNITYENPDVAKFAADTWAQEYTKLVNVAYISSGKSPSEAKALADQTYQKYLQASEAVEQFELTNNRSDVEAEIAMMDDLIKTLREQKSQALALLNNSKTDAIEQIASSTQATLLAQIDASIGQIFQARRNELRVWYARQLDLIRLQNTLKDAQSQIANGTGNLATINTKLAYLITQIGSPSSTSTSEQGITLNLDLAGFTENPTETFSSADIDGLLKQVAKSLDETKIQIDTIQSEMLAATPNMGLPTDSADSISAQIDAEAMKILSSGQTISPNSEQLISTSLYQKIETYNQYRRNLVSQREKLETQSQTLYLARASAWDLYQTLNNKAHESEAQSAVGSPQVNAPIPASLPIRPNPRDRVQASVVGGALASMMAAAAIILLDGWVLIDQPVNANNTKSNRKPNRDAPAMASAD